MERPDVARLFFPALRADEDGGFDGSSVRIDEALERGVGGFILFGGDAGRVRELTRELHRRAARPLLIGSDLERGAGQQFAGATPLPPAAALGAIDDPAVTRRAGELTAREARALGIDWVYAPVADVDVEPRNPIVGTRAFGETPERVARHVAAWVEGCRAGGALSCAKHFPGHGRTVTDSHMELPRVDAERDVLESDMRPFIAAVRAGVDSIMTAHVAYAALEPTGGPATLSRAIVSGLLRGAIGFDGVVVTDALIMEGVQAEGAGEAGAAVAATAAGCDALLYPRELAEVAAALERAIERGTLPAERVR
ncbi:MAG: glycoside hydrolase family 3 protein, partial [Gemmatimonadota bacterium]